MANPNVTVKQPTPNTQGKTPPERRGRDDEQRLHADPTQRSAQTPERTREGDAEVGFDAPGKLRPPADS